MENIHRCSWPTRPGLYLCSTGPGYIHLQLVRVEEHYGELWYQGSINTKGHIDSFPLSTLGDTTKFWGPIIVEEFL